MQTLQLSLSPIDPRVHEITALAQQLHGDELDVVLGILRGAVEGRRRYGQLDLGNDERDFALESYEELRDAVFYLGAQLARRRRQDLSRPCPRCKTPMQSGSR